MFRFKPLSKEDIRKTFDGLRGNEDFSVGGTHNAEIEDKISKVVDALYDASNGDMRRVLNILQSCRVINRELTPDMIYSMASVSKPKEVNEVLSLAASGNFLESRKKLLSLMLDYGLSGLDIIKQIQKEIWNLELEDRTKVELVDKCGETEFRMVEGSDEYIQLESFLAYTVLVGKRTN